MEGEFREGNLHELQDSESGQTRATRSQGCVDRLSFTSELITPEGPLPSPVRLTVLDFQDTWEKPDVTTAPSPPLTLAGEQSDRASLSDSQCQGPRKTLHGPAGPCDISGPVTCARTRGHTVPISGSQGTPVGGGRCVCTCMRAWMLGLREN